MDKLYAFIDEFESFGFDFSTPSNTTHFIISAIIVREKYLNEVYSETGIIRKKYL